MISLEDPRTPPEDTAESQRECAWCGLMFTPRHEDQRFCDEGCSLSDAVRL